MSGYLVMELYEQAHGLENHGLPVYPIEFVDVLPRHCPNCKAPTVIKETLSELRCSSDNCIGKRAQRLTMLLKDIQVLNMGLSKSEGFMRYYGTINPYAIFALKPIDEYGNPMPDGCDKLSEKTSHKVTVGIYEQINLKRRMLLWEYVKIGNLPGIRDSALQIFGEYSDLETFYADFEGRGTTTNAGVAFIQDKLNINPTTVSVKAVKIAETLITYKDELFEFIDYVDIVKVGSTGSRNATGDSVEVESDEAPQQMITICISSAVGAPYKSKADFTTAMKNEFGSKVYINVLGGVSKNCDYLIWSKEGSKTSKVRSAEKINEKAREEMLKSLTGHEDEETLEEIAHYQKVKIMTGQEFREYLSTL